jgi:Predicted protease of the Abi (CAAX) family
MARKKVSGCMSAGEQVAGTVFFMIYLLALPFAAGRLFRLAGVLLGTTISSSLQNVVTYYILFAVTVIIFHGFLGRTTAALADRAGAALRALGAGIVALYGLNELVYRLTNLLLGNRTNLNDVAVSAQIASAPRSTLLVVILLAPFVEEVLFRGLVFGNLREKSRLLAYALSCVLFALMHVWQYALGNQDATYLLLMVQYLAPGLVLAWAYDYSGTLWSSVGLHIAVNALSVWMALR